MTDGPEPTTITDVIQSIVEPFKSKAERTPPTRLEPGEYEAVQRDDGVVELYDGVDKEPLMVLPEEDAGRIADELRSALGGDGR
jgi:hypothetical protein